MQWLGDANAEERGRIRRAALAGKDAADNAKEGSFSLGKRRANCTGIPGKRRPGASAEWESPPAPEKRWGLARPADKCRCSPPGLTRKPYPRFRSAYRIMVIDNQGISFDCYSCLVLPTLNQHRQCARYPERVEDPSGAGLRVCNAGRLRRGHRDRETGKSFLHSCPSLSARIRFRLLTTSCMKADPFDMGRTVYD